MIFLSNGFALFVLLVWAFAALSSGCSISEAPSSQSRASQKDANRPCFASDEARQNGEIDPAMVEELQQRGYTSCRPSLFVRDDLYDLVLAAFLKYFERGNGREEMMRASRSKEALDVYPLLSEAVDIDELSEAAEDREIFIWETFARGSEVRPALIEFFGGVQVVLKALAEELALGFNPALRNPLCRYEDWPLQRPNKKIAHQDTGIALALQVSFAFSHPLTRVHRTYWHQGELSYDPVPIEAASSGDLLVYVASMFHSPPDQSCNSFGDGNASTARPRILLGDTLFLRDPLVPLDFDVPPN